jgi:sugar (pentulose or hexulose) kinase
MNEFSRGRDPAFGDELVAKKPVLVAVDLGAESCRVSLLRWIEGQPEIRLIHRFANSARNDGDGFRWDIAAIQDGIEEGLRACAQLAPEGIAAIGVDGWAVDYVRLGPEGQAVAKPFCYRDQRTVESQNLVHSRISPDRLYELTGIQILALNTLYQLRADGEAEQNLPWINLPEFLLYRLGGRRVSEYTNATHTQLLGVRDQAWSPEIFEVAGLDVSAAPPLVNPGTDIGQMQGHLASLPAFRNTRLIAPACHGIGHCGNPGAVGRLGLYQFRHLVAGGLRASFRLRHRGGAQQKLQQRGRRWRQDLFFEERKRHVAFAAMHRTLAIARGNLDG